MIETTENGISKSELSRFLLIFATVFFSHDVTVKL